MYCPWWSVLALRAIWANRHGRGLPIPDTGVEGLGGVIGGAYLVLLLRSPGVFSELPMYEYAATGWLTQSHAVKVRGVLTHTYLGVLERVLGYIMLDDFCGLRHSKPWRGFL